MTQRAFNFNAGPAALPQDVLQTAAAEMLDYRGTGISVMEMSHRSAAFMQIIEGAETTLRRLLGLPDTYRVLFLQGGGTGQFAAVPMNLMRSGCADYVLTGAWSKKAFKEAQMYGTARAVATSEDSGFSRIPDLAAIAANLSPEAAYLYICQNETIHGIAYRELPDAGGVPLVADVSSCFLSEPMDVSRYGLIWAGAQKNVGPAGTTIVIVRDDLVTEDVWPGTPTVMRYKTMADAGSLYNTPPCWGIYICGLVFEWIEKTGGLEAMGARNRAKADLLYGLLDTSELFHGYAEPASRSIMNVTFTTGSAEGDAAFVAAATKAGFVGIKGHRSLGGMRASIYNAVEPAAVQALADFMCAYEREQLGPVVGVPCACCGPDGVPGSSSSSSQSI